MYMAEQLVTVDGVELCLDDPIADRDAGIDLPAGCQRLQGGDALGYVRVRKIDDDLQRIQRQQQFLRALSRETASPSTLLNPVRMWNLSNDVGHAVTVDDGMGMFAIGAWIVASTVSWYPPATGTTSRTVAAIRTRDPTGTGGGGPGCSSLAVATPARCSPIRRCSGSCRTRGTRPHWRITSTSWRRPAWASTAASRARPR
jgi:hypothetical protein